MSRFSSASFQALDGNLVEINPYETALSQFDHTTGEYVKKPLNGACTILATEQRRLCTEIRFQPFSLAIAGVKTSMSQEFIDAWPRAEQLVRRAMLLLDAKGRPIRQTASDKTGNAGASSRAKPKSQVGFILPQAFRRLRAGRLSKVDGQSDENVDVVACGKLHAGAAGSLAKGTRKRPQAPPEPRIFGNTLGSRRARPWHRWRFSEECSRRRMFRKLPMSTTSTIVFPAGGRRGDVPFPFLGFDIEGAGMFRR